MAPSTSNSSPVVDVVVEASAFEIMMSASASSSCDDDLNLEQVILKVKGRFVFVRPPTTSRAVGDVRPIPCRTFREDNHASVHGIIGMHDDGVLVNDDDDDDEHGGGRDRLSTRHMIIAIVEHRRRWRFTIVNLSRLGGRGRGVADAGGRLGGNNFFRGGGRAGAFGKRASVLPP
jgi:hypothetical protein